MKSLLCMTGLTLISFALSAQNRPAYRPSGEILSEGMALYDSGRYKEALHLYDQINRNDTNYAWSLYESMLTCTADSQVRKAEDIYKLAPDADPERDYDAQMQSSFGSLLDNAGRREESLRIFDSAIVRYPLYDNLHLNRALVLLRMNRRAEAEAEFQKTLLLNPYNYSAHYLLAVTDILQGKMLPATLCLTGYLLISPKGRYSSQAISFLSQIANAQDGVITYRDSITGPPDPVWSPVEEIVISKLALDKNYKPVIRLDDPISRQIQLCFEKVNFQPEVNDFYMQYYMPFFADTWKSGKFELMINRMFVYAGVKSITEFNEKNAKKLEAYVTEIGGYFDQVKRTSQITYSKRLTAETEYYFSEGKLAGKGKLSADGKRALGPWVFYNADGTERMRGTYNNDGLKEGTWTSTTRLGVVTAVNHYKAGVSEGDQTTFYIDGVCASRGKMVAGKMEGPQQEYFRNGQIHYDANYKNGLLEGDLKEYFADGALKSISSCHEGLKSGARTTWYQNGQVNEKATYVKDLPEGEYQSFSDSGSLLSVGRVLKGQSEGEWKYYYGNGKLHWRRHYQAGVETDSATEFYDNGQTKVVYPVRQGKIVGVAVYQDTDGVVFCRETYADGVLNGLEYLDKSGRPLEKISRTGSTFTGDNYDAQGTKTSRLIFDEKGNQTGTSLSYYPSGRIRSKIPMKDGEKNGLAIDYYANDSIMSQAMMSAGKEEGHYIADHYNGQVRTEGEVHDGTMEGEWPTYNALGQLTEKKFYSGGDLHGWQTFYYPDGRIEREEKYRHGWLTRVVQYDSLGRVLVRDSFPQGNGNFLLLYPNGQKMTEVAYIHGYLEGRCTNYYFDGSVEERFWFHHGERDSVYQSFYYGGARREEGHYKAGKKTGHWLAYSEEGPVLSDEVFSANTRNGMTKHFTGSGRPFVQINFKEDARNGLTTYFAEDDGSVGYQVDYREGRAISYSYPGADGRMQQPVRIPAAGGKMETFYDNGKRSRRCHFENGDLTGTDTLYYHSGAISLADSSGLSGYEGSRKEFFADGKLKMDWHYRYGFQHGVSRDYYPGGTLKTVGNWHLGDQHGETRLYDKSGKLTQTRYYYYGKLYSAKNEK